MSPRIGYVYLLAGPLPGVKQKIQDQARALDELGFDDVFDGLRLGLDDHVGAVMLGEVQAGLFAGSAAVQSGQGKRNAFAACRTVDGPARISKRGHAKTQ